jgi:diguanylate cyclase (GGDEF)-like protein/putative nucleotidyltransferase with HDIG domain
MGRILDRLKGDAVRRRVIAGRVGGLLWLFAAIATPVLTLLPGVDVEWPRAMAAMAVSSVVWGVLATVVLDWRRVPAAVVDVATAVAIAYTAVTVVGTGGPDSPARLHTLLVLVYAAGFLRPAVTVAATAACAAVYALPGGGVAELAFTAPVFFAVGGVIFGGRRLLLDQALTDPLTGLANHRAFQERLHAEVARARRHGRPLTLALIDLDHFKQINDLAGHATGDRVLGELGARVRAALRDEDLLARIGGDEFALLLPETDEPAAHDVLERVRLMLEREPLVDGLHVTISAGICGLERARDTETILRLADGALYWSKEQGRNVTYVYDPATVRELSATERLDRLERSHALAGIRALARAIDAKDPSTREHSERVAALAARLAHALGWPADRVALLHEAALVHDVGKIGVPDAILLKPGRLDAAEYEQVKQHAALSARIVDDILAPEQVGWILAHHERPDGRGYPSGVTDVPDGAALLAAADCFDVMTVARPYSRAKSEAEALAECRSLVGAQFTAEAVAALEAALEPECAAAA